MAQISKGFFLGVTLKDHGGNASTLEFQYRAATTIDFASALSGAIALIADLEAVTNSVVTGYSVREKFENDAIALPVAGVENEDKASFSFQLAGGNEVSNMKIPAPVSAGVDNLFGVVGASANQMIMTAPTLVAYTDNFRLLGQFQITKNADALDVLLVGKRISAKNNNG